VLWERVQVGEEAEVRDCVIGSDAVIGAGAQLAGGVAIESGAVVPGSARQGDQALTA
jgi:carbonic anhydrase/acetyltransferase-like protein (isoleucine patch superfamily)